MTDFNAQLGNGLGVVMVFNDNQVSGALYTAAYVDELEISALSSEEGRKEATAHSQGIYENSDLMRFKIERSIKRNITKIGGIYNFGKKKWYFNQTLGRDQALDFLTAGNLNGLLTHPDTEQMTIANGAGPLIDALLGGT